MPIRFGSVSRNHWSRYPPLTVGRAGYGRVATGFGATAVTPCLLRVQRPRRTVIRGDRSPFSVGQNAWAGTPGLPRFEICRSPVPPAALPEVTATWFQVCDGAAGRPPRRGRDHARAASTGPRAVLRSTQKATTRAITPRPVTDTPPALPADHRPVCGDRVAQDLLARTRPQLGVEHLHLDRAR